MQIRKTTWTKITRYKGKIKQVEEDQPKEDNVNGYWNIYGCQSPELCTGRYQQLRKIHCLKIHHVISAWTFSWVAMFLLVFGSSESDIFVCLYCFALFSYFVILFSGFGILFYHLTHSLVTFFSLLFTLVTQEEDVPEPSSTGKTHAYKLKMSCNSPS